MTDSRPQQLWDGTYHDNGDGGITPFSAR